MDVEKQIEAFNNLSARIKTSSATFKWLKEEVLKLEAKVKKADLLGDRKTADKLKLKVAELLSRQDHEERELNKLIAEFQDLLNY